MFVKNLVAVLIIVLNISSVYLGQSYYQLLGVAKNADDQQLKRAFKKLSLKYHPDKNKQNPEAAKEKYAKIVNAYEVLKDPELRKAYNRGGEKAVSDHQQRSQHGGGHGGFDFNDFFGHQQRPKVQLFNDCDVLELNLSNLSQFFRRQNVWLILFYKPEDRESQAFKDMYRTLASKYYDIFKVAAVNCEEDEELCDDEFEARDIPSFQIYSADSNKEAEKYKGDQTMEKLASFTVKFLENFVHYCNENLYSGFVNQLPDQNKVLLFTTKKSTPPLLKVLSKELKDKLVFGEIRGEDNPLAKKFKITKFPSLVVITDSSNYKGVFYEGEFKKDQIKKFLREYAYEKKKVQQSGEAQTLTLDKINAGSCGRNDPNLCVILVIKEDKNIQAGTYEYQVNMERNLDRMKLINRLAAVYKDQSVNFFYVSNSDMNFKDSVNEEFIEGGLFLLKPKRNKYLIFQKTINEKDVSEWLDDFMTGTGELQKMGMTINEAFQKGVKEEL